MTWNDDIDEFEYDLDRDDEDPCDHDDYDVDIVTGRASCSRCCESWYVSDDEVRRQVELEAAYHEWEDRENRWQWWRDLWDRIRSIWPRRKQPRFVSDDEIPF